MINDYPFYQPDIKEFKSGYQWRDLEDAFIDVLDGQYQWYEINEHTGLAKDRCKEIQNLFNAVRRLRKVRE